MSKSVNILYILALILTISVSLRLHTHIISHKYVENLD